MAVRLVRVHRNGFGDRVLRAIIDQSFVIAIPHRRTGCTDTATHLTLEESARVILTCAEALSLHEKPLMTNKDPVLELYNRGISAHDLRSSYVGDQLGDNPYTGFSRTEIEREERSLNRASPGA